METMLLNMNYKGMSSAKSRFFYYLCTLCEGGLHSQ